MTKKHNEIDPFEHPRKRNLPKYWPVDNIVLFFDVVGFSKDSTDVGMTAKIQRIDNVLNWLFRPKYAWNEPHQNNHLILIPTGDGYAIGFHPFPEKFREKNEDEIKFDEEIILNIAKRLYQDLTQKNGFKIRMGIARGLNIRYFDLNETVNLFGYGINLANRVMSAAKKNQILVHEEIVKKLFEKNRMKDLLHGAYSVKIKHGIKTTVFNYFGDDFGNPSIPK